MEIADSFQQDLHLQQSALAQLRNTIRFRWSHKTQPIAKEEKMTIRSNLFTGLARVAHKHQLIKLYKDIITYVIGQDYK
jgi:hypothetical protein